MKKVFFSALLVLLSLAFVSSAHYITGYVEDAKDGEFADGHKVVLWNPTIGIQDNLTDIVGPSGNSGYSGVYMIDCEMLDNSCSIGEELRVKVIDEGDGYVSNYSSVIITVSGYDLVENLELNSIPEVVINKPETLIYYGNDFLDINCSFYDLDSFGTLSLFGNFSGSWQLIDSLSSFFGDHIFSVNLENEGNYSYYCVGNDGLISVNSSRNDIFVDFTSPSINSFSLNETFFCGPKKARIDCDTQDNFLVEEVFIEVDSPWSINNYSANNLNNSSYLLDVLVDLIGNWSFSCHSIDAAGNVQSSDEIKIYSYSGNPELSIVSENITFSDSSPVEGEPILMSADVLNKGCVDSGDFFVSFYSGNPEESGVLLDSFLGNLSSFSSGVFSLNYNSLIGRNEVYVRVDSNDSIQETNESNNLAMSVLDVLSWQNFFGKIDAVKILSNENGIMAWENYTQIEGNVFMTDKEADIDWLNLFAIGKDVSGFNSSEDFYEVDQILGMENYIDSVSNVYSSPSYVDFYVQGRNIQDVAIIESVNNSNFYTGILWDSSDSIDEEFDSIEKEDLVFVSNINKNAQGAYGVYDYEINIPAKLREYDSSDYGDVYFYYELI